MGEALVTVKLAPIVTVEKQKNAQRVKVQVNAHAVMGRERFSKDMHLV